MKITAGQKMDEGALMSFSKSAVKGSLIAVASEAFNYIKHWNEYTCICLILHVAELNEKASSGSTVTTFSNFYKIWPSTKTLATQSLKTVQAGIQVNILQKSYFWWGFAKLK